MSPIPRARLGLKGPRAAEWLAAEGVAAPARANTWSCPPAGPALLVARLGASEFFLEAHDQGALVSHRRGLGGRARRRVSGAARGFGLSIERRRGRMMCSRRSATWISRGCDLESRPVIMTLMIGVAVLAVARREERRSGNTGSGAIRPSVRIWARPWARWSSNAGEQSQENRHESGTG